MSRQDKKCPDFRDLYQGRIQLRGSEPLLNDNGRSCAEGADCVNIHPFSPITIRGRHYEPIGHNLWSEGSLSHHGQGAALASLGAIFT